MTGKATFQRRSAIESVLGSDNFAPPPAPPSLTPGPTADLRAEMARFSAAVHHPPRRAAVESAIAGLDGFSFENEARRRTTNRLSGPDLDAIADLGFVVPTEALGAALGVTDDALADVLADVRSVVTVIGRQQTDIAAADTAVGRLLTRFGDHPAGPVVAISLLYQNHDATAALLAATMVARHQDARRRSAIARTSRIALAATTVEGTDVSAGEVVTLDLESAELEFGAGPHACPGRAIAERIVAGIAAAIESSGYTLIGDQIDFHPDGRAASLPLRRTDGQDQLPSQTTPIRTE